MPFSVTANKTDTHKMVLLIQNCFVLYEQHHLDDTSNWFRGCTRTFSYSCILNQSDYTIMYTIIPLLYQILFILRARDRKLHTIIIYDVYVICIGRLITTWNHAVVTAARILRRRKARVPLYFAYLEGNSLTFPHPCVLHDHVLLSIRE